MVTEEMECANGDKQRKGVRYMEIVNEFSHPMGKLVLSSNPENEFYCTIDFIPSKVIDPAKIGAIRWFFEDGDGRFTGWETSLKKG